MLGRQARLPCLALDNVSAVEGIIIFLLIETFEWVYLFWKLAYSNICACSDFIKLFKDGRKL